MVGSPEKQGSFGWRYFHFIDETGSRINVIDHKTDVFGLEKKPYMTMITKKPGSEPVRFKGEPNLIWERNPAEQSGKFEFVFENAKFTGTVSETLQHEDLADVLLFRDELGRESRWAVDVPYGKIDGTLATSQEEKQMKGYMYQDRQWGDLLIQNWVKNWTWTHFVNKNLFVVVFCINTTDGQKSWHAISGQGEEVTLDCKFQVPHLEELAKAENPDSKVFQAKIKIPGKLSVIFSLQPKNVMRSRIRENHSNFSASYVRWSVDGITNQSSDLIQGIAEYMKIEK